MPKLAPYTRMRGQSRRGALLLLGVGLTAGGAGRWSFAASTPADLFFDVTHKTGIGASRIGSVSVRFSTAGADLAVSTLWDLAVKIAFVTAYTFRQEVNDRWRDGRLVESNIMTDDNGEVTRVRLREDGGALRVEGPAGAYVAEPGTMTDACFWNIEMTKQRKAIDCQYGELGRIDAKPPVEETITVHGHPLPTIRHEFVGPPDRRGNPRAGQIWYDDNNRWVQAELDTHGEHLLLNLAA